MEGVRFLAEFREAIRDGRVTAPEIAGLLLALATMRPTKKAAQAISRSLADAVYRDSEELRRAARRKRKKARDLLSRGKDDKAQELSDEADLLEEMATEREGTPKDLKHTSRTRRKHVQLDEIDLTPDDGFEEDPEVDDAD